MSTARAWERARALQARISARRSRPWASVALVAVAQAVVVLGPALGPGLVVVYDMAWAPDPRWTPFVLGLDTPAPRAVPSDAVAVALGQVLGAAVAQKVILVAILTALGLGSAMLMAELLPSAGAWARVAVTVASVWNPFVYERLAVGQWTVLLGYALLPWGLRATLRVGPGGHRAGSLAAVVVVAGVGGSNSLVIVAVSVVPVLAYRVLAGGGVRARRTAAAAVLGILGISAAWSFPAILGGAASTAEGALAFVPTADTPLGVVGSLASGGGFWNVSTHPPSREVLAIAVASAALGLAGVGAAMHRAARTRQWPFIVAVLLPTVVVALSVVPGWQAQWVTLVTTVPGGGLLRDAHKFMAAWVIAMAVGIGVLVELVRANVPRFALVPASSLLLGLPVALMPILAWGLGGGLAAVTVPQDFRQSIERLNELPPGDVALMPWTQYRRYDWNNGRVSLTLTPRLATHTVVFNDALPLRSGTIAGESERAARVTRRLDAGDDVGAAFSDAGVRYVALERTQMSSDDEAGIRRSGAVVIDAPSLLVVELADASTPLTVRTWPVAVGWIVSAFTSVVVLMSPISGVFRRRDRDRPRGLLS